MDDKTIISPEEARKILRTFDAPSELIDEAALVDIINKLDTIAYLYITGVREKSEPLVTPPLGAQPLI